MKSSRLVGGKEPSQQPWGCSCFHLHITHAPPRCDEHFPARPDERQQLRSHGSQSRAPALGRRQPWGCPRAVGPPWLSLTRVTTPRGFGICQAWFNGQLPLPTSRFLPPASKIPHRSTHGQPECISHGRAPRWSALGVGGRRMGLSYPYSSILMHR